MSRIGAGDSRDSPKPIRIVVVGDKGTGKSSLIMAVASGAFHPNIPIVLPYINFSSECFIEGTSATIIDTSSRPEDQDDVIMEVKNADSIILTFAYERQETFDRLKEFWLPLFRKLEVRVPIIVAGYKVDKEYSYYQFSIDLIMSPIVEKYPEIETSIQWSALRLNQARNIIYYAHKAVVHPKGPLIDLETSLLKPRCIAALSRIFILFDHNRDGTLNADELYDMQVKCFNQAMGPSLIEEKIIKVIKRKFPRGIYKRGLTLDGFLFQCKLYIENSKTKSLWTILRKFGYNNDLRLADDMIPYSSFEREADQSVELTDEAIEFLSQVYKFYDYCGYNNLRPKWMAHLFQTAPESPWSEAPYKGAAVENDGGLSLEAFLSLWSLMTLIDPAKTLEYLIYIRYACDLSSAIRVTSKRAQDRVEQKTEREVIQCFVFGPKNAGKSALLNQFIGRSYDDVNKNGSTRYAVNMVDQSGVIPNTKKTLVLKEVRIREDGFLLSDEALAACDVAIFVFDYSDESSWKSAIDLLAEVATMSKKAGFEFPCLMVAAKADLRSFPMAVQESRRVTQDLGIGAPIPISSKYGYFHQLFLKILTTAAHPHLNIPEIKSKKKSISSLMVVSIGTVALIAGIASFRLYAARKQS
ncbi:Mitochondrial Rho GTPase 3 [Cardamine amara subsp. amara]|uniref:Mitochondrial Rho GTPase n=1 Tax=Cardamine amara subsp. amara TaxID=228776 RepID=A0ABD1AYC7_CARAN